MRLTMRGKTTFNSKAADLFDEIKDKRDKFCAHPENSELYFDQILTFLQRTIKLNVQCYRDSYVRRRVEALMSRLGLETYRQFQQWLYSPLFDKDVFIKGLTINVTEFFRDIGPFRYLESKILPDLLDAKRKRGEDTLRIWSAGCASGEEPHSLAIILDWVLQRKNLKERIAAKIIATDLNINPINFARKGIYSIQQLRNISEESLRRNFDHIFGDKYAIKPRLKEYVDFQQHDILAGQKIGLFDIIFCRNVLIYVNKEDQITILKMFWESLNVPGYLILGKTESFPLFYNELFRYDNLNEHIYLKVP